MSRQTKLVILAGVVGVLVILGLGIWGREGIRQGINDIRAGRIMNRAETAFAQESWEEASRLGMAAHYLKPEDVQIQLLVARSLMRQRNANTVLWWQRIIESPDLPVEDLRELCGILVKQGRVEDAIPFLERLVELDGGNPETMKIWLDALQSRRHLSQTYNLADALITAGMADWDVHQKYLRLRPVVGTDDESGSVVEHLRELVAAGGDLADPAANELAMRASATREDRIMAARHLVEHGENALDKLTGQGLLVKEGVVETATLEPVLEDFLAEPQEGQLEQALMWGLWIGEPAWILERITWEAYRANGGRPETYFQALFQQERPERVLELSQTDYSEADPDAIDFLVYRAAAQKALGRDVEAEATLRHAVQVVAPDKSYTLERFLAGENNWELLSALYEKLLREDPDNTSVLLRNLSSLYHTGDQDGLAERLARLDRSLFEENIGALAFVLYLDLVVQGASPELHRKIETQLAEYPEIFDYRLIAGISFLMQGQPSIAQSFTVGMPDIGLNAPRYLRVAAAALTGRREGLFHPGEMTNLLPRERYLLSQIRE